jgi:hypothetical protein
MLRRPIEPTTLDGNADLSRRGSDAPLDEFTQESRVRNAALMGANFHRIEEHGLRNRMLS